MHKFDHPEHEASFSLPEEPTIRHILQYDSIRDVGAGTGEAMYSYLWRSLQALAEKWECELVPLDTDLDGPVSMAQVDVIKWAALAAFSWRHTFEEGSTLRKN